MAKNAAERAIQPTALGRESYFCSLRRQRTAAIISLLDEISKLNEVEGVPSSSPSRASDNYYGRLIAL